jgi:DNA-binding FadR family transcriptional regulator
MRKRRRRKGQEAARNHIRSLIENGTLQPGDKIPPEREFARSLKISRASLRTGSGYLAAMGVVKARHGVGTFVADGPPEFGKSSFSLIGALHGFQSWQMLKARIILESHVAALAAKQRLRAGPARIYANPLLKKWLIAASFARQTPKPRPCPPGLRSSHPPKVPSRVI